MFIHSARWSLPLLILLLVIQPAAGAMMPMTMPAEGIQALTASSAVPETLQVAHHDHHESAHGSARLPTADDNLAAAETSSTADNDCETLCQFCINHCSALSIDGVSYRSELPVTRDRAFVANFPSTPPDMLYRPPILA